MKTIKILFACFFAIAIGAGVSAFKTTNANPAMTTEVFDSHWYNFIGDPESEDDVKDASKYVYVSSQPACTVGDEICAVFAPGPGTPNAAPSTFDETLQEELEEAYDGNNQSLSILMRN